MLRSRSPAPTDGGPDNHRYTGLPDVEVVHLRGVIDELVEGEQQKIRTIVKVDRPHIVHCRPNADASHTFLGKRRIEDPLRAETLRESLGDTEHATRVVHTLTQHEDRRV